MGRGALCRLHQSDLLRSGVNRLRPKPALDPNRRWTQTGATRTGATGPGPNRRHGTWPKPVPRDLAQTGGTGTGRREPEPNPLYSTAPMARRVSMGNRSAAGAHGEPPGRAAWSAVRTFLSRAACGPACCTAARHTLRSGTPASRPHRRCPGPAGPAADSPPRRPTGDHGLLYAP